VGKVRIDYVQDDDWAGIYVDDQLRFQDHAIRDDHWVQLIESAFEEARYISDSHLDVFKWWVSLSDNDLRYMPDTFTELKEIAGTELEGE
jgi:hypothetical protein